MRKSLRSSATPQEIILWSRLKNGQLGYKFRRQHSVGQYIVDFYCSQKKLVIEIDGSQHDDDNNKEYDFRRTKFFNSIGCDVLRFWNNEVNTNLNGVLIKMQEVLGSTTPNPSSTEEGREGIRKTVKDIL